MSWSEALQELAVRLEPTDVEWMLVGSAATALRGAAIQPGDIDVAVATSAGVRAAAEVLPERSIAADPLWFSSLTEPVMTFVGDADSRWTFGRWMLAGVKVELAHIEGGAPADLLRETSGTAVWQERALVDWNGVAVPVVPLETQLATMIFRGQADRLRATLSAVDPASIDVAMLRRALADREAGGPALQIPAMVQRLLG
ncbi:hypothetical protein [Kribbella sp. NPDC055071]